MDSQACEVEVSSLLSKIDYNDLFGKPFKQGVEGPNAYDCYSLAREVCRRAGILLPPQRALWQQVTVDNRKRHACITQGKGIFQKIAKAKPYCIVTFKMVPPYVTHMGVVLENCYDFIHITAKAGVAVENFSMDPWKRKIDGFYEYDADKVA